MIRWFSRAAAAVLLGLSMAAGAAGLSFTEGQGYTRLPVPQPVSPAGKIVVTEFFWYDCPHCAEFEPMLERWARAQPSRVVLERVPVAFEPRFAPQQRLYYALKALGKVDALQGAIFQAIHEQHIKLETPEQMATWLQSHGVPKPQFMNAYNSFGVQMQARRATQLMHDYHIDGVPTLAVQGTYIASADLPQTPSMDLVLQAVNSLIRKVWTTP